MSIHQCSSTRVTRMTAAAVALAAGCSVGVAQTQPGNPQQPSMTDPVATPFATPEARPSAPAAQPDPKNAKGAAKGGPKAKQPANSSTKVKVDENAIVDLHVNDEDLSNVLEMLSIQSHRNIIPSKDVNARVTANLYNVTFFEALEAILNINGYGYVEEGNFIYVYTKDEIKRMAEEDRAKVSKVIKLNYLNAIDAAEFVKPLLSEQGQIKTPGKTASFPSLGETPIGSDEYAHDAMLVVIDFEENVAEVEALVAQIDTRPAQVLVEATILQTQLNEANAFGVDFSVIADMNFGEFVGVGGPLQATNALIGGKATSGGTVRHPGDGGASAVTSSVGNTAGAGGLKVGVVSNDVAVFMKVLDEVSDTTILSNPKILALNRQPSRVLVGRKVGYLQTTSTDTATTQTVEFLDTGTQLYFRPFVTNDNMIRMELKPQVSEAVIRETNDATGAAVTIPDEITNELVTNVIVPDGQTIVLGGLFRESTETARRQVPFLGDIPLLGSAFRGHDDQTERNEIIFLITPTIVNDTALAEAGARGADAVERVRAGAREGVLRWSRDKISALRNIEAERLAQSGDTQRAIWMLDRSLTLNPVQPEAIAMREKLGVSRRNWPSRSLLGEVLNGEARAKHASADFTIDTTGIVFGNSGGHTNTNNTGTADERNTALFQAQSGVTNTQEPEFNGASTVGTTDTTPTLTTPATVTPATTTAFNTTTPVTPTTPTTTTPATPTATASNTGTATTSGVASPTPVAFSPLRAAPTGNTTAGWPNRGIFGGAWRLLAGKSAPTTQPTLTDANAPRIVNDAADLTNTPTPDK
ncbi:MAG: secretin and TonB N-terminal domain-containing protein [Phycisphaerales bacterium]